MKKLNSHQKKYLRAKAHKLKPVVKIGVKGVTEGLVEAVNRALEIHELIKVKFDEFKEEKQDLIIILEEKTKSESAGLIGNVAILYRPIKDVEKRRILLPVKKNTN